MVSDRLHKESNCDGKEEPSIENGNAGNVIKSSTIKDAHASGTGSLGWSDEKLEKKNKEQQEGNHEDY
jgi:hypothetical protein